MDAKKARYIPGFIMGRGLEIADGVMSHGYEGELARLCFRRRRGGGSLFLGDSVPVCKEASLKERKNAGKLWLLSADEPAEGVRGGRGMTAPDAGSSGHCETRQVTAAPVLMNFNWLPKL